MGGHAAWKKRVANGLLAKGAGGAIARHRPRWGRKGKDLIKNRKGNIGEGNPKKKKAVARSQDVVANPEKPNTLFSAPITVVLSLAIGVSLLVGSCYFATTLMYR